MRKVAIVGGGPSGLQLAGRFPPIVRGSSPGALHITQSIFRSPSRRSPLVCSPSLSRRDAGLKMLCIM
jgi:hypothetical protein